jgi:type III secretion protein J
MGSRGSLVVWFLAALFALSGCSKAVTSDVSERDATEIVVALKAYGISSSKATGDGKKWSVSVSSSDWPDASQVMFSAGLPRAEYPGFSELMKKDSLVSSPNAERAKMLYAMGNELSRSLQDIDGVISARVHLVVPEKDPFKEKQRASSASVLIKHSAELKPADLEQPIRNFISRSAEGLTAETVSVTFVPARMPWSTRTQGQSNMISTSISNPLIGILAALAVVCAGIAGYFLLVKKKAAASGKSAPTPTKK